MFRIFEFRYFSRIFFNSKFLEFQKNPGKLIQIPGRFSLKNQENYENPLPIWHFDAYNHPGSDSLPSTDAGRQNSINALHLSLITGDYRFPGKFI